MNYSFRKQRFEIKDFRGSYDDGYISCEFKRPEQFVVNDDTIPSQRNYNFARDEYVIFLAEGAFRDGRILKHRSKLASAKAQVSKYHRRNIVIQIPLLKTNIKIPLLV